MGFLNKNQVTHLLDVTSPETNFGSLVWIIRKESRFVFPVFINVFNDDEGF